MQLRDCQATIEIPYSAKRYSIHYHSSEQLDYQDGRINPYNRWVMNFSSSIQQRLSAEAFEELLRTRSWLEERALRESISRGSSHWEEKVVLANYRLSRIPRSKFEDQFVANEDWEVAHKHFHMTLISECGSSLLLKFCVQLYQQNIRYRHLSGEKAYPERNFAKEHNAICDAVLSRDADLAAQLLIEHYNNTARFVTHELLRN